MAQQSSDRSKVRITLLGTTNIQEALAHQQTSALGTSWHHKHPKKNHEICRDFAQNGEFGPSVDRRRLALRQGSINSQQGWPSQWQRLWQRLDIRTVLTASDTHRRCCHPWGSSMQKDREPVERESGTLKDLKVFQQCCVGSKRLINWEQWQHGICKMSCLILSLMQLSCERVSTVCRSCCWKPKTKRARASGWPQWPKHLDYESHDVQLATKLSYVMGTFPTRK